MKFSSSQFWRQRGDCCIFIEVLEVLSDDGETAELKVSWNRQLDTYWRVLSVEHFRVRSRDYGAWTTYHPRGDKRTYAS